jgi:chemosensory pili system protein ChpA (sensor histidine kinase/response regulator)
MDAPPDEVTAERDLSTLAWVQGELRRSLEAAHKALRRYLKESEAAGGSDVDAVDPSVLRTARVQLHQGAGALELVGLPAAAQLLRASEAAVQRMVSRPALVDAAGVEAIEKASFALLDYLSRRLAGKTVSPVALFPQYRAVQALAAAGRVHPADLWNVDWQWQALPAEPGVAARVADDAVRGGMETLVLPLMRRPEAATLQRMSDLCAELGAGAAPAAADPAALNPLASLWRLAAAFFEAQAGGLLASDIYGKRIASRLLAQLRLSARGQNEVSDRLGHDLLFFCAQARVPGPGAASPRLAAVRRAWALDAATPVDYETARLGRFDPAWIAQARKRVAGAKDGWSGVAGGELHRLASVSEQFALVGDSLRRLFPAGEALAESLQAAVDQTVASASAPPPALAMEVATAVLYVDASLEDGEFDHPALAERVQRLAERIGEVRGGAEPHPLEAWMEELYRRVSDRQTMGSVVQELRASLSEAEKQIDQYFRDPSRRDVLIPVPGQLSAMRGVFSVLGLDQASHAVLHMRDEVDELAQTEVDPPRAVQTGTFDRLADNLGALSFLIDMLSVQPQLAKSLFRFDPETGSLSAVMGQSERTSAFAAFDDAEPLSAQAQELAQAAAQAEVSDDEFARQLERLSQQAAAADEGDLARLAGSAQRALDRAADDDARQAVRSELAQAMAQFAPLPPVAAPAHAPVPPPSAAPVAPGDTGLEDDADMRAIFLEEAREVVAGARASIERLADQPEDATEMTAVRRAFHTLKGSSRMVGLRDYGEAAWACEQLFNARLALAPRMDPALRQFSTEAVDYLDGWTEAIAAGRDDGHASPPVIQAADALRLDGRVLPIATPVAPATSADIPDAVAPPADEPDEIVEIVEAEEAVAPAAEWPTPTVEAERVAVAEAIEAIDESALPTLGEAPELPAEPLALYVPDLPSAADLDLGTPAPPPELTDLPELTELAFADTNAPPVPDEPSFELDLGEFAEPPEPTTAAADELGAIDLSAGALLAPAPEPQADVLPDLLDVEMGPLPTSFGPESDTEADVEVPLPVLEDEWPDGQEPVKVIGSLRIGIPLFNIFLNEADEQSRRLCTELAEWALEHESRPVPESSVALAHSLAGNSATVGYADLSTLARALEHALMRALAFGRGRPGEPELFTDVAEEIRRLLHQFAAGFLRPAAPELAARLAEHERLPDAPLADVDMEADADAEATEEPAAAQAPAAEPAAAEPLLAAPSAFTPLSEPVFDASAAPHARADAFDDDEDIDELDSVDAELFPIFQDEAQDLLPQLQAQVREWSGQPDQRHPAAACMRTLHTFKGGARLAGAMRLGEMAHRLETAIEHLVAREEPLAAADVEPLLGRVDAMSMAFEDLCKAPAAAPAAARPAEVEAVAALVDEPPANVARAEAPGDLPAPAGAIDWSRFAQAAPVPLAAPERNAPTTPGGAVRVRAALLDRLVNQAGEIAIARARIDADVRQMQSGLAELTESLDRLRRQLRDIEVAAETQIATRIEAAKAQSQAFDPLEMDRFTRFQELTRFMAESVNDVATLQRGLQRALQSSEDQLAAQSRLTRELQDDLLRTRMVEFESLADRLYRTVRQAAKETGKQVRLDIVGGAIEVDRGVLDRMTGPFEHLLRNCVAHGIESPDVREAAGKDRTGLITIAVTQEGNEVGVEVRDDGAGLDLDRIRQRALERGLLHDGVPAGNAELAELIFAPGFSTATGVTELAGRGVGMDVVRSETQSMGGRIETASTRGQGTSFRLVLPLTTAVTQVVMLRCGDLDVAVPSTLIESVRRVPHDEVEAATASGQLAAGDQLLPFYWLAALLGGGARSEASGQVQNVVVIRSAAQRVALQVDEVLGNQEVVVKNLGPQLSRLPALAGVTLLPSGNVALIYNPVALAALYGDTARSRMREGALGVAPAAAEPAPSLAPLVLVVDDSLTVRRVTQRLLAREGYRVVLAKDGVEALEKLAEERPVVMLSDIEMPRMDGFDLLRHVRADAALAGLPVVMITSRTAQKHRDVAAELGADHYLGKPYAEDELLSLVARHAGSAVGA